MPFALTDRKPPNKKSIRARQDNSVRSRLGGAKRREERAARPASETCRHRDPRTEVRCQNLRDGNRAYCVQHG